MGAGLSVVDDGLAGADVGAGVSGGDVSDGGVVGVGTGGCTDCAELGGGTVGTVVITGAGGDIVATAIGICPITGGRAGPPWAIPAVAACPPDTVVDIPSAGVLFGPIVGTTGRPPLLVLRRGPVSDGVG